MIKFKRIAEGGLHMLFFRLPRYQYKTVDLLRHARIVGCPSISKGIPPDQVRFIQYTFHLMRRKLSL